MILQKLYVFALSLLPFPVLTVLASKGGCLRGVFLAWPCVQGDPSAVGCTTTEIR